MRLVAMVGLVLTSLSCAADNPLYGTHASAGSGSGAGTGNNVSAAGTAPDSGFDSTTGTMVDGASGETWPDSGAATLVDATASDGGSSTAEGSTGTSAELANEPCRDLAGVASVLACWDFDVTANGGLSVLDRSDGAHDLELETPMVAAAGFWGEALNTTAEVRAIANIGDTLPDTIEIWLSSEDPSMWIETAMALQIQDANGTLLAQIRAVAGQPPTANFNATGRSGLTLVSSPLAACLGMEFSPQTAGAVVSGSLQSSINLAGKFTAPTPVPPYSVHIEARFAGFIDGIRVGAVSEIAGCQPAP